jgi:hypothetical protein
MQQQQQQQHLATALQQQPVFTFGCSGQESDDMVVDTIESC